jgi:AcrR family transcriptional regulator
MSTSSAFRASPLTASAAFFRQRGYAAPTDSELAHSLGLTPEAFLAQYPSREALALHYLLDDMERQKRDHARLFAWYASPVERLYGLISYSIQDLLDTPANYYPDLMQYPQAAQAMQDYLAQHSTPQLQQLLNEGIRQGLFRSDINIQLVTIILIQQVNIVLTPGIFPAGSFQVAEIFRSIFLYYIRGLCTDQGARLAAEHFARL